MIGFATLCPSFIVPPNPTMMSRRFDLRPPATPQDTPLWFWQAHCAECQGLGYIGISYEQGAGVTRLACYGCHGSKAPAPKVS